MKTLLTLFLSAGMCLTALGQMNYANVSNQTITASLPTSLTGNGTVTYGPGMAQLVAAGWRTITNIAAPPAGWAVDSYVITNVGATTCALAIGSQHNIQIAADAAMTNSPAWTTNFVNNCKMFRTILRAFGTTETNAVVTSETMSTWLAAYAMTNTITPQLTSQFIFMGQQYPQILQFGSSTTATFPWRLIP